MNIYESGPCQNWSASYLQLAWWRMTLLEISFTKQSIFEGKVLAFSIYMVEGMLLHMVLLEDVWWKSQYRQVISEAVVEGAT